MKLGTPAKPRVGTSRHGATTHRPPKRQHFTIADVASQAVLDMPRRTLVQLEADESAEGNYTTLFTLPDTGTPEQLAPPFLNPDGPTIIYGKGGTMKGFTAVHLVLQLLRLHHFRVLVVDFENHPNEWARRARMMGYTEHELQMVDYRSPYGDYWPDLTRRGSLNEIIKTVREIMDEPGHDCDFLVVDSYTTATSDGDSMGGAPSAKEFFVALQKLGRPSLVIAHVAGGQDRFPAKPFGSVFVHNLARETWAVEKSGADDDIDFDSVDGTGQQTIELRNMKSNGSALARPQFIKFDFKADGMIDVADAAPDTIPVAEMILEVLRRANESLTVKEILTAIKTNTGKVMSEATARKVLNRREGAGELFIRVTGSKGVIKWAATK
jgi:KaiC/GvpD/RAD55 family RecA-like ATPase